MIEKYLQDLECRIDPQVEESLFEQWRAFADGQFAEEIFSPKRSRPSPPSVEWRHVLVNDALEDCEAMALQQLEMCSKALAEGSGALLAVRCNYGTAILPSLFGGELFLMDRDIDTLPACRPLEGGAEAVKRLLDAGYFSIYLLTDDNRLPAVHTYLKMGFIPSLFAPDMAERWRALCAQLRVDPKKVGV